MKIRSLRPLALALPLTLCVAAAHAADAPSLPTADIAVESSRSAPNDQFRAQVYTEATDSNPAELARLEATRVRLLHRGFDALERIRNGRARLSGEFPSRFQRQFEASAHRF